MKKMKRGRAKAAPGGHLPFPQFGDEIEARFPVIKNVRDSMVSSTGGRGEDII